MKSALNAGKKSETRVCHEHGEYESKEVFAGQFTPCPECMKEKLSKESKGNTEKIKEYQDSRKTEEWKQKLGFDLIPKRYRKRSLTEYIADTDDKKRAINFASKYAKNFLEMRDEGVSAIFSGKPGTGKTHLACGIARVVIEQHNCKAMFVTAMKLVRRIKATWDKKDESEQESIDYFVKPDLLIIDDVGAQFGTKAEEILLFDVINSRYDEMKPTIITTNCDKDGIKEYLGERSVDRFRENGGKYIPFDWESFRKNK